MHVLKQGTKEGPKAARPQPGPTSVSWSQKREHGSQSPPAGSQIFSAMPALLGPHSNLHSKLQLPLPSHGNTGQTLPGRTECQRRCRGCGRCVTDTALSPSGRVHGHLKPPLFQQQVNSLVTNRGSRNLPEGQPFSSVKCVKRFLNFC